MTQSMTPSAIRNREWRNNPKNAEKVMRLMDNNNERNRLRGKDPIYKECQRKWRREWRKNNPEKYRRYVETHREKLRQSTREHMRRKREDPAYRVLEHQRQKEYRMRHPERRSIRAAQGRKHRYGISQEEYEMLLRRQNGLCGICGEKGQLEVDHDHLTGNVRGLLCPKCNHRLGCLEALRNTRLLEKALEYSRSSAPIQADVVKGRMDLLGEIKS